MTLGEKIKKYRILKGLTQKELGMAIGFSGATADSRIRKYELDAMAPKAEIKNKLAKALDVDLAALSENNIQSYEDIMYVLFEFEELFGMNIEKKDGKTILSFDDDNKDIATLITYINMWKNQKAALLPANMEPSREQDINYKKWKAKFTSNIQEYYANKENEIINCYRKPVDQLTKNYAFATTTSDMVILLRKIIESGFSLNTSWRSDPEITGPGFTFIVNELLNPSTEESKELFARFVYEWNHFISLGAKCITEMQMPDNALTITYYISVPSFSTIKSHIDDFLKFYKSADNKNEFFTDSFEESFRSELETFNNIEEEIEYYK